MSDGAHLVGVTGGVGGQTVLLEDLRRLAQFLSSVGGQAAGEASRCGAYAVDPDLALSAALSPVTAWQAESAIVAVAAGPGGALRVAAALTALSLRIEAAAWAYQQTEAANDALWDAVDGSAGLLAGAAVGLAVPTAVIGGAGLLAGAAGIVGPARLPAIRHQLASVAGRADAMTMMEDFATDHPDLVEHTANGSAGFLTGLSVVAFGLLGRTPVPPRGAAPSTPEEVAARLAPFFTPGTCQVRRDDDQPGPFAPPRGVSDLARVLTEPRPKRGSADVATLRSTHPDGTTGTSYLLFLPGTEDWSWPWDQRHTNVSRDAGANVQLMGGVETEYTRAIAPMLAEAGVPVGASVAIVGHSQGGLIAMQAAASRSVLARNPISHVVTMGAPVGGMPPPPGASVLSLENRQDLIPRVDGTANADRARHTTVVFDEDESLAAAVTSKVKFHHDTARYVRGAQLVDEAATAGHPSLAAQLQAMRDHGVLAGDGRTTVEVQRFLVTVDRQRPHDGPGGCEMLDERRSTPSAGHGSTPAGG